MDKSLKILSSVFNLSILAIFIGAIFFASFQFYNNVVFPIQERENRLETKDQIIPNEFIDEAEKTEKNSFDSFSAEPSVETVRTYLLSIRARDYNAAYQHVSTKQKRTLSLIDFEDAISQKHAGKIVRYRLDSVQITSDTTRKFSLTAFTLDQNNQSDNYQFELNFEKPSPNSTIWQLASFTNSLG